MISIIIPSYNRPETLKMCLEHLNRQTYRDFSVCVVDDGSPNPVALNESDYRFPLTYVRQDNAGPARARNRGASMAKGDLLLFIGDDCQADRNLLFRHVYSHTRDHVKKSVQGYTLFHPDVVNPFTIWLDESGLQANYKSLKNQDGSWRNDAGGFCLTTNYSIHRQHFENLGGFNERFGAAAWEDVLFGYNAQKIGVPGVFDPGAINWHNHRMTIESYVRRQLTEGKWRITLCLLQPEMSSALIHPESLRVARQIDVNEQLLWAKELEFVMGDDVKQQKYARWAQLMQIASLKGLLDGIDTYPIKAIKAVEHVHSQEAVHHILSGVAGIERSDLAYSQHCCGWLLQNAPQNWATFAFCTEVNLHTGDYDMTREMLRQAIILGSGEKWIDDLKERVG
jgi:GT2 family glycosyltransferase